MFNLNAMLLEWSLLYLSILLYHYLNIIVVNHIARYNDGLIHRGRILATAQVGRS